MDGSEGERAHPFVEWICALGHRLRIGRWPDLVRPRAFNEKIQAYKLRTRHGEVAPLVDKVAVKDHVARLLGPEWVIPTFFAGATLPEQRDWPVPYVLKANNSSGRNLFVRDAASEDWEAVRRTGARWMRASHPALKGEWLYSQISPRLLVEPLLGGPALPHDYKFFVFSGRVEMIQLDTDRASAHKRKLYDRSWTEIEATLHYPRDPRPFNAPATLGEMIAAAEILGAGHGFVRVDFYEIEGRPLFGEMTFTPGAGVERFTPDELDYELGAKWPWPTPADARELPAGARSRPSSSK